MPDVDQSSRTVIELTGDELALVLTALRLFLRAEDDTETINQLKDLLGRLPNPQPS